MSLTTKQEAKAFYDRVLEWSMKNWNVPKLECNRENAVKLLRKNLLYWADRFSKRTSKEIGELYDL